MPDLPVLKLTTFSACQSGYAVEYDGHKYDMLYWIITGGTPALGFADYSFIERYNYIKKYDEKLPGNEFVEKYKHQTWVETGKNSGYPYYKPVRKIANPPSVEEVGGAETVKTFLDMYAAKHRLRTARAEAVRVVFGRSCVVSPTFRNEDRRHFRLRLAPDSGWSGMPRVGRDWNEDGRGDDVHVDVSATNPSINDESWRAAIVLFENFLRIEDIETDRFDSMLKTIEILRDAERAREQK